MSLFHPAPYKEEIQDPQVVKEMYQHWRIRVFYSMFIGYAFYYFVRRSFTYAMPALICDLSFDKSSLGMIASVWSITYGLSKFVSGVMCDRSNVRYFMALGLIITGFCNVLFGMCSSLYLFAVLWGLNGWFQGYGPSSCAKLLTQWYSQSERGRWWALWNASHNIGGALIPLITVFLSTYYGWRFAMIIPASASILMGFFLINRLRDTPQSLGLPAIEKYRNDMPAKVGPKDEKSELSVKEILFEYVLNNPAIWILAIAYFFVYVIRMGIGDWSCLYLVEAKNYTQIQAGSIVFWYDIGGIFGSLVAGWASDKIFNGRRCPINVIFSLAIGTVIMTLWGLNEKDLFLDSALIFAAGFFIYGPQMLIGMAAAELVHKKAAATANGFAGWAAYLGGAVAGYPLGKIAQEFGWAGYFTSLLICAALSAALLVPLWNARSRDEAMPIFKDEEEKEEAGLEPVNT